MTTAIAEPALGVPTRIPPRPYLRLVQSAPAQGPEAIKVQEKVRAIGTESEGAQGYSHESEAIRAIVRDFVASIEALQNVHSPEESDYKHVPLKTAFTVKATYQFTGKMAARQFPDEAE